MEQYVWVAQQHLRRLSQKRLQQQRRQHEASSFQLERETLLISPLFSSFLRHLLPLLPAAHPLRLSSRVIIESVCSDLFALCSSLSRCQLHASAAGADDAAAAAVLSSHHTAGADAAAVLSESNSSKATTPVLPPPLPPPLPTTTIITGDSHSAKRVVAAVTTTTTTTTGGGGAAAAAGADAASLSSPPPAVVVAGVSAAATATATAQAHAPAASKSSSPAGVLPFSTTTAAAAAAATSSDPSSAAAEARQLHFNLSSRVYACLPFSCCCNTSVGQWGGVLKAAEACCSCTQPKSSCSCCSSKSVSCRDTEDNARALRERSEKAAAETRNSTSSNTSTSTSTSSNNSTEIPCSICWNHHHHHLRSSSSTSSKGRAHIAPDSYNSYCCSSSSSTTTTSTSPPLETSSLQQPQICFSFVDICDGLITAVELTLNTAPSASVSKEAAASATATATALHAPALLHPSVSLALAGELVRAAGAFLETVLFLLLLDPAAAATAASTTTPTTPTPTTGSSGGATGTAAAAVAVAVAVAAEAKAVDSVKASVPPSSTPNNSSTAMMNSEKESVHPLNSNTSNSKREARSARKKGSSSRDRGHSSRERDIINTPPPQHSSHQCSKGEEKRRRHDLSQVPCCNAGELLLSVLRLCLVCCRVYRTAVEAEATSLRIMSSSSSSSKRYGHPQQQMFLFSLCQATEEQPTFFHHHHHHQQQQQRQQQQQSHSKERSASTQHLLLHQSAQGSAAVNGARELAPLLQQPLLHSFVYLAGCAHAVHWFVENVWGVLNQQQQQQHQQQRERQQEHKAEQESEMQQKETLLCSAAYCSSPLSCYNTVVAEDEQQTNSKGIIDICVQLQAAAAAAVASVFTIIIREPRSQSSVLCFDDTLPNMQQLLQQQLSYLKQQLQQQQQLPQPQQQLQQQQQQQSQKGCEGVKDTTTTLTTEQQHLLQQQSISRATAGGGCSAARARVMKSFPSPLLLQHEREQSLTSSQKGKQQKQQRQQLYPKSGAALLVKCFADILTAANKEQKEQTRHEDMIELNRDLQYCNICYCGYCGCCCSFLFCAATRKQLCQLGLVKLFPALTAELCSYVQTLNALSTATAAFNDATTATATAGAGAARATDALVQQQYSYSAGAAESTGFRAVSVFCQLLLQHEQQQEQQQRQQQQFCVFLFKPRQEEEEQLLHPQQQPCLFSRKVETEEGLLQKTRDVHPVFQGVQTPLSQQQQHMNQGPAPLQHRHTHALSECEQQLYHLQRYFLYEETISASIVQQWQVLCSPAVALLHQRHDPDNIQKNALLSFGLHVLLRLENLFSVASSVLQHVDTELHACRRGFAPDTAAVAVANAAAPVSFGSDAVANVAASAGSSCDAVAAASTPETANEIISGTQKATLAMAVSHILSANISPLQRQATAARAAQQDKKQIDLLLQMVLLLRGTCIRQGKELWQGLRLVLQHIPAVFETLLLSHTFSLLQREQQLGRWLEQQQQSIHNLLLLPAQQQQALSLNCCSFLKSLYDRCWDSSCCSCSRVDDTGDAPQEKTVQLLPSLRCLDTREMKDQQQQHWLLSLTWPFVQQQQLSHTSQDVSFPGSEFLSSLFVVYGSLHDISALLSRLRMWQQQPHQQQLREQHVHQTKKQQQQQKTQQHQHSKEQQQQEDTETADDMETIGEETSSRDACNTFRRRKRERESNGKYYRSNSVASENESGFISSNKTCLQQDTHIIYPEVRSVFYLLSPSVLQQCAAIPLSALPAQLPGLADMVMQLLIEAGEALAAALLRYRHLLEKKKKKKGKDEEQQKDREKEQQSARDKEQQKKLEKAQEKKLLVKEQQEENKQHETSACQQEENCSRRSREAAAGDTECEQQQELRPAKKEKQGKKRKAPDACDAPYTATDTPFFSNTAEEESLLPIDNNSFSSMNVSRCEHCSSSNSENLVPSAAASAVAGLVKTSSTMKGDDCVRQRTHCCCKKEREVSSSKGDGCLSHSCDEDDGDSEKRQLLHIRGDICISPCEEVQHDSGVSFRTHVGSQRRKKERKTIDFSSFSDASRTEGDMTAGRAAAAATTLTLAGELHHLSVYIENVAVYRMVVSAFATGFLELQHPTRRSQQLQQQLEALLPRLLSFWNAAATVLLQQQALFSSLGVEQLFHVQQRYQIYTSANQCLNSSIAVKEADAVAAPADVAAVDVAAAEDVSCSSCSTRGAVAAASASAVAEAAGRQRQQQQRLVQLWQYSETCLCVSLAALRLLFRAWDVPYCSYNSITCRKDSKWRKAGEERDFSSFCDIEQQLLQYLLHLALVVLPRQTAPRQYHCSLHSGKATESRRRRSSGSSSIISNGDAEASNSNSSISTKAESTSSKEHKPNAKKSSQKKTSFWCSNRESDMDSNKNNNNKLCLQDVCCSNGTPSLKQCRDAERVLGVRAAILFLLLSNSTPTISRSDHQQQSPYVQEEQQAAAKHQLALAVTESLSAAAAAAFPSQMLYTPPTSTRSDRLAGASGNWYNSSSSSSKDIQSSSRAAATSTTSSGTQSSCVAVLDSTSSSWGEGCSHNNDDDNDDDDDNDVSNKDCSRTQRRSSVAMMNNKSSRQSRDNAVILNGCCCSRHRDSGAATMNTCRSTRTPWCCSPACTSSSSVVEGCPERHQEESCWHCNSINTESLSRRFHQRMGWMLWATEILPYLSLIVKYLQCPGNNKSSSSSNTDSNICSTCSNVSTGTGSSVISTSTGSPTSSKGSSTSTSSDSRRDDSNSTEQHNILVRKGPGETELCIHHLSSESILLQRPQLRQQAMATLASWVVPDIRRFLLAEREQRYLQQQQQKHLLQQVEACEIYTLQPFILLRIQTLLLDARFHLLAALHHEQHDHNQHQNPHQQQQQQKQQHSQQSSRAQLLHVDDEIQQHFEETTATLKKGDTQLGEGTKYGGEKTTRMQHGGLASKRHAAVSPIEGSCHSNSVSVISHKDAAVFLKQISLLLGFIRTQFSPGYLAMEYTCNSTDLASAAAALPSVRYVQSEESVYKRGSELKKGERDKDEHIWESVWVVDKWQHANDKQEKHFIPQRELLLEIWLCLIAVLTWLQHRQHVGRSKQRSTATAAAAGAAEEDAEEEEKVQKERDNMVVQHEDEDPSVVSAVVVAAEKIHNKGMKCAVSKREEEGFCVSAAAAEVTDKEEAVRKIKKDRSPHATTAAAEAEEEELAEAGENGVAIEQKDDAPTADAGATLAAALVSEALETLCHLSRSSRAACEMLLQILQFEQQQQQPVLPDHSLHENQQQTHLQQQQQTLVSVHVGDEREERKNKKKKKKNRESSLMENYFVEETEKDVHIATGGGTPQYTGITHTDLPQRRSTSYVERSPHVIELLPQHISASYIDHHPQYVGAPHIASRQCFIMKQLQQVSCSPSMTLSHALSAAQQLANLLWIAATASSEVSLAAMAVERGSTLTAGDAAAETAADHRGTETPPSLAGATAAAAAADSTLTGVASAAAADKRGIATEDSSGARSARKTKTATAETTRAGKAIGVGTDAGQSFTNGDLDATAEADVVSDHTVTETKKKKHRHRMEREDVPAVSLEDGRTQVSTTKQNFLSSEQQSPPHRLQTPADATVVRLLLHLVGSTVSSLEREIEKSAAMDSSQEHTSCCRLSKHSCCFQKKAVAALSCEEGMSPCFPLAASASVATSHASTTDRSGADSTAADSTAADSTAAADESAADFVSSAAGIDLLEAISEVLKDVYERGGGLVLNSEKEGEEEKEKKEEDEHHTGVFTHAEKSTPWRKRSSGEVKEQRASNNGRMPLEHVAAACSPDSERKSQKTYFLFPRMKEGNSTEREEDSICNTIPISLVKQVIFFLSCLLRLTQHLSSAWWQLLWGNRRHQGERGRSRGRGTLPLSSCADEDVFHAAALIHKDCSKCMPAVAAAATTETTAAAAAATTDVFWGDIARKQEGGRTPQCCSSTTSGDATHIQQTSPILLLFDLCAAIAGRLERRLSFAALLRLLLHCTRREKPVPREKNGVCQSPPKKQNTQTLFLKEKRQHPKGVEEKKEVKVIQKTFQEEEGWHHHRQRPQQQQKLIRSHDCGNTREEFFLTTVVATQALTLQLWHVENRRKSAAALFESKSCLHQQGCASQQQQHLPQQRQSQQEQQQQQLRQIHPLEEIGEPQGTVKDEETHAEKCMNRQKIHQRGSNFQHSAGASIWLDSFNGRQECLALLETLLQQVWGAHFHERTLYRRLESSAAMRTKSFSLAEECAHFEGVTRSSDPCLSHGILSNVSSHIADGRVADTQVYHIQSILVLGSVQQMAQLCCSQWAVAVSIKQRRQHAQEGQKQQQNRGETVQEEAEQEKKREMEVIEDEGLQPTTEEEEEKQEEVDHEEEVGQALGQLRGTQEEQDTTQQQPVYQENQITTTAAAGRRLVSLLIQLGEINILRALNQSWKQDYLCLLQKSQANANAKKKQFRYHAGVTACSSEEKQDENKWCEDSSMITETSLQDNPLKMQQSSAAEALVDRRVWQAKIVNAAAAATAGEWRRLLELQLPAGMLLEIVAGLQRCLDDAEEQKNDWGYYDRSAFKHLAVGQALLLLLQQRTNIIGCLRSSGRGRRGIATSLQQQLLRGLCCLLQRLQEYCRDASICLEHNTHTNCRIPWEEAMRCKEQQILCEGLFASVTQTSCTLSGIVKLLTTEGQKKARRAQGWQDMESTMRFSVQSAGVGRGALDFVTLLLANGTQLAVETLHRIAREPASWWKFTDLENMDCQAAMQLNALLVLLPVNPQLQQLYLPLITDLFIRLLHAVLCPGAVSNPRRYALLLRKAIEEVSAWRSGATTFSSVKRSCQRVLLLLAAEIVHVLLLLRLPSATVPSTYGAGAESVAQYGASCSGDAIKGKNFFSVCRAQGGASRCSGVPQQRVGGNAAAAAELIKALLPILTSAFEGAGTKDVDDEALRQVCANLRQPIIRTELVGAVKSFEKFDKFRGKV